MQLSDAVLHAGQHMRAAAGPSLPDALMRFLAAFIGSPYAIQTCARVKTAGQQSDPFTCIVFRTLDEKAVRPVEGPIPAGQAAAVVDGHEELTIETLRAAYSRIAAAKRLQQGAQRSSSDTGQRNELLGVLLGLRSTLTLEAIAEEMRRLNEQGPASDWPDMVIVADTGVVQYSAQFPGENIMGDFFLPNAAHSQPAPVYVVMTMKPLGEHTLNRMLAFIVAHLAASTPRANVPPFPDVVKNIRNTCVTVSGYQFNLASMLMPVPRQFYNDRYLAPRPFIIEDGCGRTLATVQFLPWQDGGVVRVQGEFPLQMLLVHLAPKLLARGTTVVQRASGQISYAMPLTEIEFRRGLERFQRRSNMCVRPDETRWVVKKFADEGSSSPFIARLLIGICKLRDAALLERGERNNFDEAYQSAMTPLFDARARVEKITALWERHAQRITAGEIVRVQGHAMHIDENVDGELFEEFSAFVAASTRALKTGMQVVTARLGVDLGFLFQKEARFGKCVKSLAVTDAALANYLRHVRAEWSKTLLDRRNAIEHEGWQLGNVAYRHSGNGVRAVEPVVDELSVTAFAVSILDRLTTFVEEVTTHLLQRQMTESITITEIPLPERSEETPERFRLTLAIGGLRPWEIAYRVARFEET